MQSVLCLTPGCYPARIEGLFEMPSTANPIQSLCWVTQPLQLCQLSFPIEKTWLHSSRRLEVRLLQSNPKPAIFGSIC